MAHALREARQSLASSEGRTNALALVGFSSCIRDDKIILHETENNMIIPKNVISNINLKYLFIPNISDGKYTKLEGAKWHNLNELLRDELITYTW